jgi:GNAT superfamily N-acetyltransferase
MLEFEIVKARLLDLSVGQIARLRNLTLPLSESDNSYMRDTLDELWVRSRVEVAIALVTGEELGWSMIRPYYGRRLIQVFVKPEHRRHKLGTRLFQALNDGGKDITATAWNQRSWEFFNSLGINFNWEP